MTAKEKIEQLIETRKILKSQTENPVSETYIDMFIKDLQSLQEPTEEIYDGPVMGIENYGTNEDGSKIMPY